jgi:hypothetical protein
VLSELGVSAGGGVGSIDCSIPTSNVPPQEEVNTESKQPINKSPVLIICTSGLEMFFIL